MKKIKNFTVVQVLIGVVGLLVNLAVLLLIFKGSIKSVWTGLLSYTVVYVIGCLIIRIDDIKKFVKGRRLRYDK